uniref:Uncharacterized protein n=1 Tax=Callithrix jacchus TaxID=9483 RepID=F7IMI6_CALJA
ANTWLLFLPLFPVKLKTPMVIVIGAAVFLLDLLGLLQLGQLLMFHIYLSMSLAPPDPLSPRAPQAWVVRAAHLPHPPEYIPCPEPPTLGAGFFATSPDCSRSASARNEIMGKKGKSQEEMKSVRAQQTQQGTELTPKTSGAVPSA